MYFGPIFPGKLLDFTTPIDSFAIKRINTYNRLGAPRQQFFFLTGISFQDLRYSPVTVIQTPHVKPVPAPSHPSRARCLFSASEEPLAGPGSCAGGFVSREKPASAALEQETVKKMEAN